MEVWIVTDTTIPKDRITLWRQKVTGVHALRWTQSDRKQKCRRKRVRSISNPHNHDVLTRTLFPLSWPSWLQENMYSPFLFPSLPSLIQIPCLIQIPWSGPSKVYLRVKYIERSFVHTYRGNSFLCINYYPPLKDFFWSVKGGVERRRTTQTL